MDLEQQAIIFDFGHFRNTDGPGIRTMVFFKGCPLRCLWCSNPFGLSAAPQIAVNQERCVGCGRCVPVCPVGANTVTDGKVQVRFDQCTACGACVLPCPASARMISGRAYTVRELFDIVSRDAAFYRRSGGGVTLSGGEVLTQYEAAASLLELCRKNGIHTCVETSAYGPWAHLEHLARYCDLLFVDLKHIDPARHRALTGVSNEVILENLRQVCAYMAERGRRVIVRHPVIPGCNDEEACSIGVARFVSQLAGRPELNLLPYHDLGEHKYAMIGRTYTVEQRGMLANSAPRLLRVRDLCVRYAPDTRVSIGGEAIARA